MGPSQIDAHGNTNISCIGDWERPTRQLLGVRGGPGNTLLNPTSYWVPKHSTRVFTEKVDMVSGIGWDRGAHEIRAVVTNLAVLDFGTPDRRMRLRSVHPGVSVGDVVSATGFELAIPDEVPETRPPDGEELRIMREVLDPKGLRERGPLLMEQVLDTPLTRLAGCGIRSSRPAWGGWPVPGSSRPWRTRAASGSSRPRR